MNTNNPPVRELFGFERDPFVPDPATIWLDDERRDTIEQLGGLVGRGGFAALTGPAGCGKTILLGHLCSQLNSATHRVIYIACSEYGPADMLRLICTGLDLKPPLGRSRATRRIADRVAEMRGITPVLIVDEAQSLPQSTLDALRVLCSHGQDGRNRFAVVMAGTDEFLGRLSLRVCESLRQRITVYAEVALLTRAQTQDYLRHRFETAGVTRDIIGGEAFSLLFDITNGVPRRIDKLADEALRRAAREGTAAVALDHIQRAARTVFGPGMEPQS
jgi:general secretion pathway protein A